MADQVSIVDAANFGLYGKTVGIRRAEHDRDVRGLAKDARCAQPAVLAAEPDIHQDRIGPLGLDQGQRRRFAIGGAHHLMAPVFEHQRQRHREDHLVFDDR